MPSVAEQRLPSAAHELREATGIGPGCEASSRIKRGRYRALVEEAMTAQEMGAGKDALLGGAGGPGRFRPCAGAQRRLRRFAGNMGHNKNSKTLSLARVRLGIIASPKSAMVPGCDQSPLGRAVLMLEAHDLKSNHG